MGKQAFDRKLESVEVLREADAESAIPHLRKALQDRSNYVVAKAAGIVGERLFAALTPDLLSAFDRFMLDASKTDPQCWAKIAIVKALLAMEHSEPQVFLPGIRHVQLEAVWGGRQDSAGPLRSACAMALVQCALPSFQILTVLIDLLNDAEAAVRIDAARAIAQLSAREGVLPLRLKALIGDSEPEVVGHCLSALLSLAPEEYLPFVAGYLENPNDDMRMEGVAALAALPDTRALDYVKKFWNAQVRPQTKATILMLLSGSPLPESAEFLLHVIETATEQIAGEAFRALSNSRYATQLGERGAALIASRFPSSE